MFLHIPFIFHILTLFHMYAMLCYFSEDIKDILGYFSPSLLSLIFFKLFVSIAVFCDGFSSGV